MRPIIGITIFEEYSEKGKKYSSVNSSYAEAILSAGGLPILIPMSNGNSAREYANICDGILFSGGEDVSPFFYDENPIKQLGKIDTRRDIWEKHLYEEAIKKQIPILGICRGCQAINVFRNGTLYQDIDTQLDGVLGHHPTGIIGDEKYHSIVIKEGTVLHDIFKKEKIMTNSFHHQAVKKIGNGLIVTALSSEGVIEAYESENMNEQFILGIQWHPEAMVRRYEEFLGIFKKLIETASK